MEDVEGLRRALFDVQTRNFVLENQVADLAGGRDSSAIHEELLSTRKQLEQRDDDVQMFERKMGICKEEVRQLKQLLVKARGTISAYDERNAEAELAKQQLFDKLASASAERNALRQHAEQQSATAAAMLCAVEVLAGSLGDVDGEYDALLSAHLDYTSEMEASRHSIRRNTAHEQKALSEATGEVARLRLDGSKQRGRVAALETEAKQLRAQLHVKERAAGEAGSSAADAARDSAVLEVQLAGARDEAETARAAADASHAELEARGARLAAAIAELERERAHGEAAGRRRDEEAGAAAEALGETQAELGRRTRRVAGLEAQLANALRGGGATRHTLEETRASALCAEVQATVQLRALGSDFAALEAAHAVADEGAQAVLASARAHAAADAAKAERETAQRAQALQAQLAKARTECEAFEIRLGEAQHKLALSAKHANQTRALQSHVADLTDRLDKKSAMCERLLKRGGAAGGATSATSATSAPGTARASSDAARPAAPEPGDCGTLDNCVTPLTTRPSAPVERAAPLSARAGGDGAPQRADKEQRVDKENLGGGGEIGSAPSAAHVTTRASPRPRSSVAPRPAFGSRRASGGLGADGRVSGTLALPVRQSDRSVLTPKPRSAMEPAKSPAMGDPGKPCRSPEDGSSATDAEAEEPLRNRRKSGTMVVPSRYLLSASKVSTWRAGADALGSA
ncbi:hypothetical protein T492DRAFT_842322 [Pavlovales sp. CCMP2436]|nr:hypothetical protein T492DRAFT_842322 [Pavlovales sp. CCMP2436]